MKTMIENSTTKKWDQYYEFGQRIFFKRNSIIYEQGTIGNGFYYIHKGLIKIVTAKTKGGEKILSLEGSGQLFGEQAMDQEPYFSTAIAADDCVLYYFSKEQFNEIITRDTEMLSLFMDSTIGKIRILADEILAKGLTAQQKIALTLIKICTTCNTDKIFLTQQELANYTGLTRISVYKAFKQWKEAEIIDVVNRMVIVKQPDTLKKQTINL
ncbi:Crp/Fnr family transcriptional regulator [Mesobacillus jeotgali]|uniref:Crp/Fnr family transcriptional regulator n=1 Tax=Mesobacillus jeotgali TaxID=129985 RepID=UPI0013156475|nr:Crp/Fnr family transcriptional regulator [Mesobacillus jeotgali]